MIKSVSSSQHDILHAIQSLHLGGRPYEADLTYGSGSFWNDPRLIEPALCFDVEPLRAGVIQADSGALPIRSHSLNSAVFDPPFLTYVRQGRSGNGSMVMARRFSGYWHYDELREHYQRTLSEAGRVIRPAGVFVVKCQDIVHNHTLHPTGANVIHWASDRGLVLLDQFVLTAEHRMTASHIRNQKHARVHHTYFLVFSNTNGSRRQSRVNGR